MIEQAVKAMYQALGGGKTSYGGSKLYGTVLGAGVAGIRDCTEALLSRTTAHAWHLSADHGTIKRGDIIIEWDHVQFSPVLVAGSRRRICGGRTYKPEGQRVFEHSFVVCKRSSPLKPGINKRWLAVVQEPVFQMRVATLSCRAPCKKGMGTSHSQFHAGRRNGFDAQAKLRSYEIQDRDRSYCLSLQRMMKN